MEDIKRILVVCRVAEDWQAAVHHGILLSRMYGAELYIIHRIYDPFIRGDLNFPMTLGVVEDEYIKTQKDARRKLDAIITEEKTKGITIKELIKEGKPVEEIMKVIHEEKIDLLIMLGHEESRLEHFLLGRSNDEIIRKLPCSILILKKEPEPA